MNLSQNDLLKHIWVTTYETVIGFLLGTMFGIFIAILLWWSNFLSKVSEPFLVVLNSLPKVALRTGYYNLGGSRNFCYYSYGCCNITYCIVDNDWSNYINFSARKNKRNENDKNERTEGVN